MHGTASTVRAFLLIEVPGPWGTDALRGSRLPLSVAAEVRRQTHLHGIRPLLIRRHGRSEPAPGAVFAAYADPHWPWLETAVVDRPEEVLDLDLAALGAGRSAGLHRTADPVFLTCTHGRHDRCCAERGRPVAAALSLSHPAESWEVSHIGGDRFAGNLLVLPDGLYYGRVDPTGAADLARRHRAGHLDLAHLRGRCGYGFALQSAEWYLRSSLVETGRGALKLEGRRTHGALTEATFAVRGRRWRVRVARSEQAAQRLTCGSASASPVPVHELVAVESLDG